VKKLRLGVPRALFYDSLEKESAELVAAATQDLGRLAGGVRDVQLPAMKASAELTFFPEAYVRIITAEAYAFHQEMLRQHPERYHPGTRKSIEGGAGVSAADYIRARNEMDRLRAESAKLFAEADLLITPTAPGAAFEFGKGDLIFLRNTAPWNLLGLPTVSIPCGFTRQGMPVGLQITGAAGTDYAVLALASSYQGTTDWHTRQPAIS
jgi:aspartyl-tRNA(Asn)/glutamyl-tRNA(Gln) amidotransferase subunit A